MASVTSRPVEPTSAAPSTPDASKAVGCDAQAFDVATFRGNATRAGLMPGPLPPAAPVVAWKLQAGGELHSSPAVVRSTVFQGTTSGTLLALDLQTGRERWRADLDGGLTSPTVVGDLVVVGTTENRVTALDRSTGTVRWTADLEGRFRGAPAPIDDGVLVASTAGDVTLLDLIDGRPLWTTNVGGEISRSIAVAEGLAVVPVQPGELVALDPESGRERWRSAVASGGGVGTPAADAGLVMTGTGLDSGDPGDRGVIAVDLATGTVAWRWASPDGEVVYTPAVVDRRAYAVSEGGFVVALDATTGGQLWRTEAAGPIEANPAVAEGAVVVADNAGTVLALDQGTGETRWSAPIEGVPYAAVVTCGLVLVPTSLGLLTAFGPA
jgi:outer membrane protein assembly factor BamB